MKKVDGIDILDKPNAMRLSGPLFMRPAPAMG